MSATSCERCGHYRVIADRCTHCGLYQAEMVAVVEAWNKKVYAAFMSLTEEERRLMREHASQALEEERARKQYYESTPDYK